MLAHHRSADGSISEVTPASPLPVSGNIGNGANVALGATVDTAATTDTGNWSLIALIKRLLTKTPALNATWINRSSTIATGGAAQQLMAANGSRLGWRIQNNSAGDLWFSDTGSAAAIGAAGSYKVVAGSDFESAPGRASVASISIIGATTGQIFSAAEF